MTKVFGLIGKKLGHSFSKRYFTEKFARENIGNCTYQLFEIDSIDQLPGLIKTEKNLVGLNVTIPYKQEIIPFLSAIDKAAERIKAVNVVRITADGLVGFNSDYYGFKNSLNNWIGHATGIKALVLGTGGSSRAVHVALDDLGIEYHSVSRSKGPANMTYDDLSKEVIGSCHLIINTTPLGMYPEINSYPDIPYGYLTPDHYLFDLVYNPLDTEFMNRGQANGARVKNGIEMLELQAEKSWEIWNAELA
ncbi:MAG: shikimate dehydrogenase [Bacteroidetes bacterium]|nr:shikimate dehydrogenase [Bacteroidota bacterium]MDA1120999.1 shikimate dehydrogenase [Bacteroidota bacterium]